MKKLASFALALLLILTVLPAAPAKAAGGTIHAASMDEAEKIIIDECLKALEEIK